MYSNMTPGVSHADIKMKANIYLGRFDLCVCIHMKLCEIFSIYVCVGTQINYTYSNSLPSTHTTVNAPQSCLFSIIVLEVL